MKRLILVALTFVTMQFASANECSSDQLSMRFCSDISMLTACFEERSECDSVKYVGGNMARSMYYIGRVESSLQALSDQGRLKGEVYLKAQEFINLLSKRYWWAVSFDGNYIAAVNEMNRIIKEVENKCKDLP